MEGVFRSLALIVLAIQLSRPAIPKPEAERYAKVLQHEAKAHGFDPLTGVAIIHFESYWLPTVVSKDGEDYGLAQIRARYVRGCRDDEDPVSAPSEACVAAKARLLDGESNIRRMAALITANRELCEAKHGRVLFHEWLASYQGRNRPAADKWCVPGEGTWRVVNYRKELIAKLLPKQAGPGKLKSDAAWSSSKARPAAKAPKAVKASSKARPAAKAPEASSKAPEASSKARPAVKAPEASSKAKRDAKRAN